MFDDLKIRVKAKAVPIPGVNNFLFAIAWCLISLVEVFTIDEYNFEYNSGYRTWIMLVLTIELAVVATNIYLMIVRRKKLKVDTKPITTMAEGIPLYDVQLNGLLLPNRRAWVVAELVKLMGISNEEGHKVVTSANSAPCILFVRLSADNANKACERLILHGADVDVINHNPENLGKDPISLKLNGRL